MLKQFKKDFNHKASKNTKGKYAVFFPTLIRAIFAPPKLLCQEFL